MTRTPAKCGTRSGYRKHKRENTEPCSPCYTANREYQNEWDRNHGRRTRQEPVTTPERQRLTNVTYEAWVQERRKRGVPPEGLHAA